MTPFTLNGVKCELTPLFDLPSGTTSPQAARSAPKQTWFKATPDADLGAQDRHRGWDLAYRMSTQFATGHGMAAGEQVLAVEPDLEQSWFSMEPESDPGLALSAARRCEPDGQSEKKGEVGPGFAWHLTDDYTSLSAARAAANFGDGVKIAHLDTGYDPSHRTKPQNLDASNEWNFVDDDTPRDARDRTPSGGVLRNQGHGTGTLGILAGAKLSNVRPQQANTDDYLGGAPHASIFPMRVANSVVHFWTSSVAQAIDKARELNADVLSMSMGGIASRAWADAVNKAYESGLVMVCAAGNNYEGLPTSNLVYPARFDRVIAACGAMADGTAYHELDGIRMEGNAGPNSRMGSAIAAYTPNIPWPKFDCVDAIDLDGGGTSSATPQVAAAAALWIAKNGGAYPRGWKRVEAVRKALFASASQQSGGLPKEKIFEFFGNGVLRADAALKAKPAVSRLKQTSRDNAILPFLRMLTGLGAARPDPLAECYALELTQLVLDTAGIADILPDPHVDPTAVSAQRRRKVMEAVLDDGRCSQPLGRFLERKLGRGPQRRRDGRRNSIPVSREKLERRDTLRPPSIRRLRIFAYDPAMANRPETAAISEVLVEIPWEGSKRGEPLLQAGPVGDYLEIIDIDPASGLAYAPVDLNQPYLLAQNGLAPSEGSPQFHQQMVYAVGMKTIDHFERALGRRIFWAERPEWYKDSEKDPEEGFVRRLRIYPHALRQSNAYYSPDKVALLFGYFPETRPGGNTYKPGGMVFTCLSHDIVAHEMTHALLDGLHRRFKEDTNPDVLAFHEAFADIVAIFQHFTYPEILRFVIGQQRGQLDESSMLSELARQFGEAIGYSSALRSAIGLEDTSIDYATTMEPHDRGSILVAAVFRAFVTIYKARTADLIRIATGGSGVLPEGALHPDLVNRLAREAARAADHVLTICIRALDYCPPVDITFSDYLRALVTADANTVAEDHYGYRVAFLDAFRFFNIYPEGVRTISVESLMWSGPEQDSRLHDICRGLRELDWDLDSERLDAHLNSRRHAAALQRQLEQYFTDNPAHAYEMGLDFSAEYGKPRLEVHSIRPARRVTPEGTIKNDGVVVLTQSRTVRIDLTNPDSETFRFRGGCTLIVDLDSDEDPIRYAVVKNVASERRLAQQQEYLQQRRSGSLHSLYFGQSDDEPFALIHTGG